MTRRRRSLPPAPSPDLGAGVGVMTRRRQQQMAPSSPSLATKHPSSPRLPPLPPAASASTPSATTSNPAPRPAETAAAAAPSNPSARAAATATSTSTATAAQTRQKHILAQADALARMTIELNLRAVAAQADRLERDLKSLVECTARDRAFRDKHEQRLEDMWREILAVKQRMGEFRDRSAADVERCRAQTAHAMEMLSGETGRLRALVDDVGGALDRLSARSLSHREAEGETGVEPEPGAEDDAQTEDVKRRVRETLGSTRRWNRDHKTTTFSDPAFVARYLKQQSKRDPRMAVLIQRALQKRAACRTSMGTGAGAGGAAGGRGSTGAGMGKKPRPQSLEQLCEELVWGDVIETVEELLVRAEGSVGRMLR